MWSRVSGGLRGDVQHRHVSSKTVAALNQIEFKSLIESNQVYLSTFSCNESLK